MLKRHIPGKQQYYCSFHKWFPRPLEFINHFSQKTSFDKVSSILSTKLAQLRPLFFAGETMQKRGEQKKTLKI